MELNGTYELNLPPEVVWSALFDAETLASAIPGCERLEQTAETRFPPR